MTISNGDMQEPVAQPVTNGAGRGATLAKRNISVDAIRLLPAEFVKRHRIIPLEIEHGVLHIATADPGNQRLVDDVRLVSGLEVKEFEAPANEILEKIAECYQITVEQMVENLNPELAAAVENRNLHDIEVMANEPTVINLVNVIISTALRERASDIHFVPFEGTLQLRYRIDGLLQEKPPPPKHLHAAIISRIKIMADMNIAERFLPQDGHIEINHRGARVDIRVGTMPTIYGESMVLRLLEKNSRLLNPQELGLDAERATLLSRLVGKPHGLFLATGPTGSGKTTTLYAILSGIYAPEKKILTIEDPVEYELAGVAQIPVRPARGFTFATGLRSILRQDPDVIMVGEIRDSETAEIAIRAALTGHQVFSTLHTNDSAGAVTRLLDMGVEAFLISSSLDGVLAQRLVRRVCRACRAAYTPDAGVLRQLGAGAAEVAGRAFSRAVGCKQCHHTGYQGRLGIFEFLPMNEALRDLVVGGCSLVELRHTATEQGMKPLRHAGLAAILAGETTVEEVLKYT